ncbi:nitrite reductase large subunit NirB [Permianibacter fluminis]|uniref:nitrite reductase large subunit NirB n=1 Tax=Permianibacter fluminis TaxID=2738515 RepID=UPI001B7D90D3|nr:nitrite reductase large subunit NirB [Permianibacter fluminis]
MKQQLVLVGNGMAGMKVIEELLALAPERYDITVFGAEPHGNYNRILLSPVLAGEKQPDEILINPIDWYAERGIQLHCGKAVTVVDRDARIVRTDCGIVQPYDQLILATGSLPFVLPIPGRDLAGVVCYRDLHDVEQMLSASRQFRNAVVIGGGLLGLEAAYGLQKQGMAVTVVHLLPTLMDRQLDATAATLLQQTLEARGIKFKMAVQTSALLGTERVTAVQFADGSSIPADLVVMAAGVRPNIALAQRSGLGCERGVLVSDTLQSSDARIYAVGECVQHRGQCYGLVAPLYEQARVCAAQLAGNSEAFYQGSMTSTKLKVTGVELFSAGEFQGGDGCDSIVYQDAGAAVYKKVVLRGDKLVGAVLYGDTVDGGWYFQLMKAQTSVAALRDSLLFGPVSEAEGGGQQAVLDWPDDKPVCDCNGVCKGKIVETIRGKNLQTLDAVRAHTKASASCGACTPMVEQLLAAAVGDNYSAPALPAMCSCTTLSHDAVRSAIREQKLLSLSQIFQTLAWRHADGCDKCRPALNFYLLAAWPGEAQDDSQARFVNERMHANIQKDGSYSVVPRMWGGVTNSHELRSIADVVDKFQIPTVKITGGQRVDLLGVKKSDLPGVWADLAKAGFVSGHAYGKALRTVKTCVGSEWCRFGTQDSTAMGIQLEKLTWGAWTPHKFKMAVSGCPRNCAEATIKDFGVIAIESGWELHVGGNGGIKLRGTDVLCRVETMAEVEEYCLAFMQLYRDEGRYLERTAPYLERVGLAYVQQRVVHDAAGRQLLAQRFRDSQQHFQKDPWAELASPASRERFIPIVDLS